MKELLLWARANRIALDHVTLGSLSVVARDLAMPPSPGAEKQKDELLASWIETVLPPEAITAMKGAGAFAAAGPSPDGEG